MLHADDAGLSPEINQAILRLVQEERLESLSIIANSPRTADFTEALNKLWPALQRPPQVFLHFNLVECRPLVPWPKASERIDEAGNFYVGYGGFIRSLLKGRIDPQVVRAELTAQYDRLVRLGFTPSGIDSHQHMHALAPIAQVVRDFAREHGIASIRSYDDMQTQTAMGSAKLMLFRVVALATELRYGRRVALPPSWHGHTWRAFLMTSWEPVRSARVKKGQLIACHPGSTVDRGFIP